MTKNKSCNDEMLWFSIFMQNYFQYLPEYGMEPMQGNSATIDGSLQDFHPGESKGFTICGRMTFSKTLIGKIWDTKWHPCPSLISIGPLP